MVYLDNNATTPIDPRVAEKVGSFIRGNFGNPSSLYPLGREVKSLITEAREEVAAALGARRQEIIFTSSGTEADNLAILGLIETQPEKREFITSSIEHPAVQKTARYLEGHGYTVYYLPVDQDGIINLDFLKSVISSNTVLVSVMLANNEIGTIQPVEEVVKIAHHYGVPVHTDAVQALGKIDVKVDSLGVDLLSLSAHKVYGPKGTGALYVRKGLDLKPVMHGGHQEFGLRPGTENTAGIVGFGEACRILIEQWKKDRDRIEKLAYRLKSGLEKKIKEIKFNGHPIKRIKSTLNFSFPGLAAEAILLALATAEIYVSTGSACSEGSGEISHVLLAMGLSPEEASSAIRFSVGRFNTEEDIEQALAEVPEIINGLRRTFAD
ncbi:MAG TPA: cysteine desulfurase family protein [Candidatus Saccharicenans sp.]|jgi:cysteine desulfurase|nr:cysteine desulfurase [Candidatus Saccharicenans sp.]HRD01138.1 cysteine desulfurase family protein [Candidatus Saccharicenans sp.]